MESIANHLPELARAAAETRVGMAALVALLVAVLALAVVRRSTSGWRMAALALLFAGGAAFGYAVFQTSSRQAAAQLADLQQSLDRWLAEATRARDDGALPAAAGWPTALRETRDVFAARWKDAAPAEQLALPPDQVAAGLSLMGRLYRDHAGDDGPAPPEAVFWADEAIRHFDARQDPRRLTDALLDKAAIHLHIAQRTPRDRPQFEAMARVGDAMLARAFRIAAIDQQPMVLRTASRFYYELARPGPSRRSDRWDNGYLLLAYEKARAAHDLQPGELGNADQLARAVIRVARNPPQDTDPAWAANLRDAQDGMAAAWSAARDSLTGADRRLSALDVLGGVTLEAIVREWSAADAGQRRARAGRYLIELERDALPPLRQAAGLLTDPAQRKAHGFDIHHDLARALALKTALVRASGQRARAEFQEVRSSLAAAREHASTAQLEAALRDLGTDPSFALLTPAERQALAQLLNLG